MQAEIKKYDEVNHILAMRFETGNIYYYLDVEPQIVSEMRESGDVGKFFQTRIAPRLFAPMIDQRPISEIGRCPCGRFHQFRKETL